MPLIIKSVKFWINAFIPDHIEGLTRKITSGPFKGKTTLSGPITSINDCFLTDNRSFSNSIHAKSRMHSEFTIRLTESGVQFSQWHNCDETVEIDCEDGSLEGRRKQIPSNMNFKFPASPSPFGPIKVSLRAAANNPLFSGSPNINYAGETSVDFRQRTILFDGRIDGFPAFEAYAAINDGPGVTMFNLLPLPGSTPFNLVGGATRGVKAKLGDPWGINSLRPLPLITG